MSLLDAFNALLALVFVLGLILGLYWLVRRAGAGTLPWLQVKPPAERRLSVQEQLMIDPRRRLLIVRCDDQEHLLLLSPNRDAHLGVLSAQTDRGRH